MIGYSSPDWSMGAWYAREDAEQRREDAECRLVRMRLAECRKIAENIAHEFRLANGNTTDADFLAETDNECWHDWLLPKRLNRASGNITAMTYTRPCCSSASRKLKTLPITLGC